MVLPLIIAVIKNTFSTLSVRSVAFKHRFQVLPKVHGWCLHKSNPTPERDSICLGCHGVHCTRIACFQGRGSKSSSGARRRDRRVQIQARPAGVLGRERRGSQTDYDQGSWRPVTRIKVNVPKRPISCHYTERYSESDGSDGGLFGICHWNYAERFVNLYSLKPLDIAVRCETDLTAL